MSAEIWSMSSISESRVTPNMAASHAPDILSNRAGRSTIMVWSEAKTGGDGATHHQLVFDPRGGTIESFALRVELVCSCIYRINSPNNAGYYTNSSIHYRKIILQFGLLLIYSYKNN